MSISCRPLHGIRPVGLHSLYDTGCKMTIQFAITFLLLAATFEFSQQLHFPKTDRCDMPPVTGPCKAYIPSYFFNSKTKKCERFVYGGCGGSANRFYSKLDCQRSCSCFLPPESGRCFAAFPRWYYDSRFQSCRQFIFGGCGGNDNNFRSLNQCSRVCAKPSINNGGWTQQRRPNTNLANTRWKLFMENLLRGSQTRKIGNIW